MSRLTKTIIFKVDDDMHDKLNSNSNSQGFNSVSAYIRVQLKKALSREEN